MAGQSGAIMLGLANGLSGVPAQINSLQYQNATQAQQLQSNDIANQMAALNLQQAQGQAQMQADENSVLASTAMQGSDPSSTGIGSGASGTGTGGNVLAGASLGGASLAGNAPGTQQGQNGQGQQQGQDQSGQQQGQDGRGQNTPVQLTAPTGGLPATQNGQPNGQPLNPMQRAVMKSESNGQAGATSPKGAQGTMQTMPGTQDNPGFGVRPAQNDSPAEKQRVGADYLVAMQKRYGNDADALVAYNWGPANADRWIANGRNPNQLPPATKSYVQKTLANLKQQQTNQAVSSAIAQPSPVDKQNARADSGVTHTLPELQQTSSAQDKAIQWYRQAADKLRQQGNAAGYLDMNAKADKLQQQQLDNKAAVLKAQDANYKEIGDDLHGSTDQKSYDAAITLMRQNPDVYRAYMNMNPTGQYDQDRSIIATMQFKGEGLKDIQANANKAAVLNLNQQKFDFQKRKAADAEAVKTGTYVPTDMELGGSRQVMQEDTRFSALNPDDQTYAATAIAKIAKGFQVANPSLSPSKAQHMAAASITPDQVTAHALDNAGAPRPQVAPVDVARLESGELISSIIPSRGKDAYAARSALFNAAVADKMAKNPGMDIQTAVNELNMSHGNQIAKGKSVGQLTTMYNNASIAMSRMDTNQRLAEDAIGHLGSTDLAPVLNAVARKEQKFVGDPYQTQLFNAINGFADENAKFIVGGFTGSGATSDSSRNQSLAMFNADMTPAQLAAAFKVSNTDARMTLTAISGQLGTMGGTTEGTPSGTSGTPAAGTAPAGNRPVSASSPRTLDGGWKLMQDRNGNYAYVSADGKQVKETY